MSGFKLKRKLKPDFRYITSKMPLEKFIPAAFLIFLLCFIILSLITYRNINEYKTSVEQVNRTQEVLKKTDRVNILLTQLQLSRRGYIVKLDNKYLSAYYDNKLKLKEEIPELKELIKDNPVQQNLVSRLDSFSVINQSLLDSSLYLFEINKKVDSTQTGLALTSQNYLDTINTISSDIKTEEINLLNLRQNKAQESSFNIQIFIILTSLFAFTVIGLSLFISNRLIKNKNNTEVLLRQSYDELEDRVEARTSELKVSNENLTTEIDNRIKIETSLRESEGRFRVMADSSPVLIWMSGKDKLFYYFNKVWLEYTGRSLKQESGDSWYEGVHPDDIEKCTNIYNNAFDRREEFEIEFRLKNADGNYRWILNKGIPRFEGNEFAGYIGCCFDIHSKKKNERFLKIQYAVSKTLTEYQTVKSALSGVLQDVCSIMEWDFGVLWVVNNDKLVQEALWSKSAPEVKSYSEIYDNKFSLTKGVDLPGRVWKEKKSAWIEDIESDDNFPRKPGAVKLGWKSGFAIPVTNGSEVTAVIECFSISHLDKKEDLLQVLESVGAHVGNFIERKKTEEKLKESYSELEERVKERTMELAKTLNRLLREIEEKEKVQNKLKLFAHSVKGIKEGIFITNLENETLFINSAFESTFGYYEEELLNKKIPVIFSDSTGEGLKEEVRVNTLRGGWKGELETKRKDGSEFHMYLSTSVIRNDEGKAEAIVGICQDISELKRSETLIKKQNRLLELLNNVILVTNKSIDANNSITYAINKVCQYTKWDAGHCFLKNEEGILVSPGLWNYNLDKRFDGLKEASEKITFKKGESMPGLAYKEAKAYWHRLSEIDESTFFSIKPAKTAGLKTGIWVPIMKQTEAIGVLEFFKDNEESLDAEVLECIANIGVELGSLVERNEIMDIIIEREKHFKAVADTANDAIITANKEGKIIYSNKTVETLFGYTSGELVNQSLTILMPERFKEKHLKGFERTALTGQSKLIGETVELAGRRKNSEEFPLELSLAKWEMNNETFFTGMIKDISLRKQIESELIENQKTLERSQRLARLGSWEWDIMNNKVKWSPVMYSLYELKPEEFKGTLESFVERLHPDDVEYVKGNIERSIQNKEPFSFFERIITPKGEIKILKSQGEVKTGEDGNVIKLVGTCLDVTEIRMAEEKIIESEKQLREAQKIAKLGSWEWNAKTDKVSWSEEMYKIFEMEEGAEITNEKYLSFIHPDDLRERDEAIREAIEENKPFNYFLRIITDLGKTKILNSQGEVYTDGKKNIVRMIGTITDETEVKTAEALLRVSEERFRLIVENIKDYAIIMMDTSGKIVSWNKGAEQIKGYSSGEIIGKHFSVFYSKEDVKKGVPNYNLKMAKKLGRFEAAGWRIRKDGTSFWADIVYTTLHNADGSLRGFIKVTRDVTERKKAEEAVIKSEKQLKDAQQIAKLGSFELNISSGDITWSDEMYRIYDLDMKITNEDKVYDNLKKYTHPDDVEYMDKMMNVLGTELKNTELQYRIITNDGRLKYLNCELRVDYDENSAPVRIYGSIQDITEIKLVEEELRKAHTRLIEAQKELIHNEKLAALGRFSSGIAHEIRNPLANISALAQLVSKTKIEDEKIKKHLKYILINSDIANKIIKDLLHFASPEDLIFSNENITEILENIVNSVEPRCIESKISVSKHISHDLPELRIDKVKFEAAFMNFLSNSIDAMAEGGNLTIKARHEKTFKEIVIDIIDTGEGISQENLDKIFEPFFTTKATGTGLGLGLAYQTIKSHHGILNIYSEPGKGTHVEIKLPVENHIGENGKNINN